MFLVLRSIGGSVVSESTCYDARYVVKRNLVYKNVEVGDDETDLLPRPRCRFTQRPSHVGGGASSSGEAELRSTQPMPWMQAKPPVVHSGAISAGRYAAAPTTWKPSRTRTKGLLVMPSTPGAANLGPASNPMRTATGPQPMSPGVHSPQPTLFCLC